MHLLIQEEEEEEEESRNTQNAQTKNLQLHQMQFKVPIKKEAVKHNVNTSMKLVPIFSQ